MRVDNFIAFFTVCGFFVGLVFVILKVDDPIKIVLYTIFITLFFYLLIHIIIMNYIGTLNIFHKIFNKEGHEEVNNYLILELASREKELDKIIQRNPNPELKKADKKKNERLKAKAA